MTDVLLPSKPIAGFDPYDDPKEDDLLAIVEAASGKTLKIKAKYFGQSTPSTNYKWSSTFDYPVDAIVDHLGKWYLSLQTPNLGNNPASSPLFWQEQTKVGSGLIYWVAGVYTADPAVVIKTVLGVEGIYKLNSATPRPFLSSDFDAELLAGDWVSLGSPGGANHFKGAFASEAALTAAFPAADPGDYALVDVGSSDAELYIWDETDTVWLASGVTTVVPDASPTTKGIAKLYNATGNNTDGSMTQDAITAAIAGINTDLEFNLMANFRSLYNY